jgi:DMSO reductase anchor subunit
MRPAFSVIFFTVAAGCGYGLLFLLGLALACNPMLVGRSEALILLGVGAVFVAAGLLASTLHLGQPHRAWRAFSQWRSSWLSREGVASVASFVPILALAWCLWRSADANALRGLGILLATLAAFTVVCTAKIYTSLKTIPAWRDGYVLPGYLLLGLLGGVTWMRALDALAPVNGWLRIGLSWLLALLALASWLLKRAYWRDIDSTPPFATPESATGLGGFGAVRSVEAPHTEENYLTREMGFVLARKHAKRLRSMCLLLIGPLPILLTLTALMPTPRAPMLAAGGACATALIVTAGLFVERWLFFAQAKHVVMLYYGASRPA